MPEDEMDNPQIPITALRAVERGALEKHIQPPANDEAKENLKSPPLFRDWASI